MANLSKMESEIPLFRFPIVVLREVFGSICLFDLVNVSRASQKSKQFIQRFVKGKFQKSFHLGCWVGPDKFRIELQTKCSTYTWMYVIASDLSRDEAEMLEKFKRYTEYFQEVFGWKIGELCYEMDSFPDQNRQIIDWLRSRQKEYEFFEISGEINTDTDLKYLLDSLKTTECLIISSKIKDDFQVEFPENLINLEIDHARFIKFEQLLRMKSRFISLRETSITSQEINTFLKNWMTSESQMDLEYLSIGIENEAAMVAILDGIPHEVLEDDDVNTFEFYSIPVNGGFVIKRNDGKSARIVTESDLFNVQMKMFIY